MVSLADSNITKKALATAMKELIEEEPFGKISVADVCDRCEMSRKSFYYHFQDKYDLVNWIFDTEFFALIKKNSDDPSVTKWGRLEKLFKYLYENRGFYSKVLQIEGQNSFSEHFRELLYPVLYARLKEILGEAEVKEFYIGFFSDAFLASIIRWLREKDCMPPDEFLTLQKDLFKITSITAAMD